MGCYNDGTCNENPKGRRLSTCSGTTAPTPAPTTRKPTPKPTPVPTPTPTPRPTPVPPMQWYVGTAHPTDKTVGGCSCVESFVFRGTTHEGCNSRIQDPPWCYVANAGTCSSAMESQSREGWKLDLCVLPTPTPTPPPTANPHRP